MKKYLLLFSTIFLSIENEPKRKSYAGERGVNADHRSCLKQNSLVQKRNANST